jgi:hypothetical protein
MEFPIADLLDYDSSVTWLIEHFHPSGFQCPTCHQPREHFNLGTAEK